MHRLSHLPLGFVVLATWLITATVGFAQPKPLPDDVELIRDVEYGKGSNHPLTMHILRPKKTPTEKMPVLVWFHGGGWEGGSKDGGINRLESFAQRGYLCATIGYRFSKEATFPAQIEDAKCAIRFLRAKAKDYHLDPQRIGAWGYSAGGASCCGCFAYFGQGERVGREGDGRRNFPARCKRYAFSPA